MRIATACSLTCASLRMMSLGVTHCAIFSFCSYGSSSCTAGHTSSLQEVLELLLCPHTSGKSFRTPCRKIWHRRWCSIDGGTGCLCRHLDKFETDALSAVRHLLLGTKNCYAKRSSNQTRLFEAKTMFERSCPQGLVVFTTHSAVAIRGPYPP